MNDKVLLDNIERLLKAKGISADALSKAAAAPDAIRNLRRRVAGEKQGSWKLDTLASIADALGTTPWELLRPSGAIGSGETLRDMVREAVADELAAHQPVKTRSGKNIR